MSIIIDFLKYLFQFNSLITGGRMIDREVVMKNERKKEKQKKLTTNKQKTMKRSCEKYQTKML